MSTLNQGQSNNDVKAMVKNLLIYLNLDELQNQNIPPFFQFKSDKEEPVYDDTFGKCPENPIRVNGSIGEMTYLSKLRTADTGSKLLFHRLGSGENCVDIFEVVSYDGSLYDILYLDMYYEHKSPQAPSGYSMVQYADYITGISNRYTDFPLGIVDTLHEMHQNHFGFPLVPNDLRQVDLEMLHELVEKNRK